MRLLDYIISLFRTDEPQNRAEERATAPQPSVTWTTEDERLSAHRELKKRRITPETITSLEDGEIFVFGTSISGSHTVGASRYAVAHFGAIEGMPSGRQGRSYAIPTEMDVETIRPYVVRFTDYARKHPENLFLVTPVGCGAAGHLTKDIAPLFKDASSLDNVCLPQCFWDVLVPGGDNEQ